MILASLREKRATILAWVIGGALAMYFEALAIAAELRDFPGGPAALAESIYPTIEGMRIIRWPADRLDTLGGYLAYHNVVLFNFFLALFAGVQGARLIRHLEEKGAINFYLSAEVSRKKFLAQRALGYLAAQFLISLALGIGTAIAMTASDAENWSGSILTLLAGGICIFPFFGLGVLISQFISSARTAAGITSVIVTTTYVLDNISGKYGWLHWFTYLSPFHYANLSRPLIPGFDVNYLSWAIMLIVGAILLLLSVRIFERRDIGGITRTRVRLPILPNTTSDFVPKTLIGDILWRQRYGLILWVAATTTFITVFISLMSGVIEIWRQFAFLQEFTASGFGSTPEEQYLAMVFEILPPFISAFIIAQSSKWTADLTEGRIQFFLSAPISWGGLLIRRGIATLIGAGLLIALPTSAALAGSSLQGVEISFSGILRVLVMSTLFALAFTSLCSLLVSVLRGRNATQVLSIYVGAAWLIGFMAPYLKWPEWLVRLSIFDAFGHPYVAWPGRTSFSLIATMILLSSLAALKISNRSAKV